MESWNGKGTHPVAFLRQRGWTQHSLVDDFNRVCMLGAACNASCNGNGRSITCEEEKEMLKAIQDNFGAHWHSIGHFNDNSETTYDVVESLLVKVYGDVLP